MAKIQTYSLSTLPLSLSDMLIGTEVGGPIPNATKNFSLGDLLDLFRSNTSPLTSKGDLYTFSTVNTRLGVGSNGQFLAADSTSDTGLKWVPAPTGTSPLISKGDIFTYDTANARLPLGFNGQILAVDVTQVSGLSWINPPSASPLTTKGDIYIYSTTNARLGVGVNGQILSADSTSATGLSWINNTSASPLTTKGDLYTFSTINARLSVGTNGQLLSVDNTSSTGLKWINAPTISPLNTKGDLYSFSTTNTRLGVGSNGQILSVDNTTATGLKWINAPTNSPLTTKGDLYTFDTVNTRLSVGANGQILSADSTSATGLKWINVPSSTSPLTSKGDMYVFSTTNTRLPIGANGQILSANSASSTGLSWINAPSTSPLTTKGDLYTFDTVNARLSVGTNGQILSADSTEATGLKWVNAPVSSPLTTKGDIYIYSTTNARLGVGTNGQILSADSTQASGLIWIDAPSTSPLTTKGDLYTFDTVNARLSVGSNGQILSVDSTEPTGLKWINAPSGTSPLTTKGDIYVFGTTNTRLPIGADSQVLIADSTQPTGLRWAGSPIGTGYYAQYFSYSTQTATTNNVGKAMIFETFDMSNGVTVVTDGTNLTKITFANAGKYNLQFSTQLQSLSTAPEDVYIWLRKNGTTGTADVVGSTGVVGMEARKGPSDPYHIIAGWNFLLDVNANDFYQIVWATTNVTDVEIRFYAATTNHPSTASTLFTVTQPGGGGGGTQNLDNVLYQGGSFTSSRYSDLDFYDWELARVGKFRISSAMPSVWEFSENKLQFYDEEYANNLFYADYFTIDLKLGDFRNYTHGCYIELLNTYKGIYFWAENNPVLEVTKNYIAIGDLNEYNNCITLIVSQNENSIYTILGQNETYRTNFGFKTQYTNLVASLGDYNNENNNTKIVVTDSSNQIDINARGITTIGDALGYSNNTQILINNSSKEINLSSFGIISIGDTFGIANYTKLEINDIYKNIATYCGGQQFGIEIDYNNITTKIGDFAGNNQFTQIEIYDSTREIYLQSGESIYIGDRKLYSGGMYLNIDTTGNVINAIDYNANVPFGIQLLMNTYDFYFGDFSGQIHGANLRVSGGGDITTYGLIGGGMNAYGFTTSINGNYTKLGDFLQYKTWTTLEINDSAEPVIFTKFYFQDWGIKILNQDIYNSTDNIAILGDHRPTPTNIALRLNYLGNSFNVNNVDAIALDGNISSTTSGGNSGQYLKITINGTNYKINLLNP